MSNRLVLGTLAALLSPALLRAQSITVPATRGFHPTAVLLPHVRYVVAADSDDGSLLIADLAVPPAAFAGAIRIEGTMPYARQPERRPFADTVRFETDGRVQLLLADAPNRPPMIVEVTGARGVPAGRINVIAPRWPLTRVLLATISPADLYDLVDRVTGFGVRDRIRVDDRQGFAFITDSSTGSATVAIGFGRGTRGRFQSDVASVIVARDFGGQVGRERRTVGAISMILEPARDDEGTARAEIVFGVGDSEAEAMRAAQAASQEPQVTPRASSLRWQTPSADANLLVRHVMAASGWMLDWDAVRGERSIPSSAARPIINADDASQGAVIALQRGDTAAVCGSYRLLRSPDGSATRSETGLHLTARGRTFVPSDSTTPADDAALVMLGYACYSATRSRAMLQAEYPVMAAAAARAARAGGEAAGEAVERLAELDDELVRLIPGRAAAGDSLRVEAARLAGMASAPMPGALWRSVFADAQRGIASDYGRLSAGGGTGGLSSGAAGTFVGSMAGEIFGITEYLDHVEIAPQLGGIADDQTWTLDGWLLARGDTLGLTYRPATRTATIRLSATQLHRIVLRLPWLTATSCVTSRRGPDAERLPLVQLSDGSFYIDVRAAFDPATITLTASACAP